VARFITSFRVRRGTLWRTHSDDSSGSAFFWYGPCYEDTLSYTVTLDGNANSQPQAFNASLAYPFKVVESCLRYYAGGLSRGGAQHEFLATNAEDHWMTLQWLEIWDYELVGDGSGGSR